MKPALFRRLAGGVFCLLVTAAVVTAQPAPLPIRGLHCNAPLPDKLDDCIHFIEDALPKEGVNVLVLEFNYRYRFTSHPEVSDENPLTEQDVKKLLAACRRAGVRLIPQINCLGHQSWASKTHGLLRSHPEFDETPGKYPGNKGIYCRSYCPLHPKVHDVLFDLIDELADACEADAFHVGMDEVFLLGEDDCPRCRGKNKAELFAGEVKLLHDHLARSGRAMWMWGDRFLDAKVTGIDKWSASANQTAPAISMVPKDIVICDWHYNKAEPTAVYFALRGFPVVSSPWRRPGVALDQLEQIRFARDHASPETAGRLRGVLHTTWQPMAAFVEAYYGKGNPKASSVESALCFKDLFREMRDTGLAPKPSDRAQ